MAKILNDKELIVFNGWIKGVCPSESEKMDDWCLTYPRLTSMDYFKDNVLNKFNEKQLDKYVKWMASLTKRQDLNVQEWMIQNPGKDVVDFYKTKRMK